jgi:hypothetical protein
MPPPRRRGRIRGDGRRRRFAPANDAYVGAGQHFAARDRPKTNGRIAIRNGRIVRKQTGGSPSETGGLSGNKRADRHPKWADCPETNGRIAIRNGRIAIRPYGYVIRGPRGGGILSAGTERWGARNRPKTIIISSFRACPGIQVPLSIIFGFWDKPGMTRRDAGMMYIYVGAASCRPSWADANDAYAGVGRHFVSANDVLCRGGVLPPVFDRRGSPNTDRGSRIK